MHAPIPVNRCRVRAARCILAAIALSSTLAVPARAGGARDPAAAPVFLTLPDEMPLENAFWACDYVATYGGHKLDVTACSAIYEALKERKFGGDFQALMEWWQRNKAVEHARLRTIESLTSTTDPPL